MEEVELMNITAFSLQKPSNALVNKRFIIAENVSYILLDSFRVSVEYSTSDQPKNEFTSCISRVICGGSEHQRQYPEDSLHMLKDAKEAAIPEETPFGELVRTNDDIITILN